MQASRKYELDCQYLNSCFLGTYYYMLYRLYPFVHHSLGGWVIVSYSFFFFLWKSLQVPEGFSWMHPFASDQKNKIICSYYLFWALFSYPSFLFTLFAFYSETKTMKDTQWCIHLLQFWANISKTQLFYARRFVFLEMSIFQELYFFQSKFQEKFICVPNKIVLFFQKMKTKA